MYNLYAIQQYLRNPHPSTFSFFYQLLTFLMKSLHLRLSSDPHHPHSYEQDTSKSFSFGHILLFKFFISLQRGSKTCARWAFGRAEIPASDALTSQVILTCILGVNI